MAVIEKTTPDILFIPHNLFAFDLYDFIKGYITSAWCSKVLNIGDTTHPAARRRGDVLTTSLCKSQWRWSSVSNEARNEVSVERRQDIAVVRLHNVLLVCCNDVS